MKTTREEDIRLAAWLMVCKDCKGKSVCDTHGVHNCSTFAAEVEQIARDWDKESEEYLRNQFC